MKKFLVLLGVAGMTLLMSSCFCTHWDDDYYYGRHGYSYGPGYGRPAPPARGHVYRY